MKAQKGERLACKCGRDAGYFKAEVADGAPILQEHLVLDARLMPGLEHGYQCFSCGEGVAWKHGEAWTVMTKSGPRS